MKLYCNTCQEPLEFEQVHPTSEVAYVKQCVTCMRAERANAYHNGYNDGKLYRQHEDNKKG